MKLHKTFAVLLAGISPLVGITQASQPPTDAIVNIAELDIDPAQLDAFKAAVIEGMNASVRLEPGVYAIYAVAHKDDPTKLMFFEIYASKQAQEAHRNSPHFLKFHEVTKDMVRSRRFIETDTVHLAAKP